MQEGKRTEQAYDPLVLAGSRSMGNRHTSLDPQASSFKLQATSNEYLNRKDIMRVKIKQSLQKRFKQWCKKNDMTPERAANAFLNNYLEEIFEIIDGDDQPPSDKPQA